MAAPIWKRLKLRLRYWLHHSKRQRLLWEEMEFHVDSMAHEFAEQGMTEPEAGAAARRKFGNMTQQSENARTTWIARWLSDLTQDLRQAFRGMRRDIGFTVFTILIAGIGIGASCTVFSLVNALLLRPLPFRDPARLVWISNGGQNGAEWTTQVSHFLDLRQQNHSFTELAGYAGFYGIGDKQFTGTGEPERLTAVPVTQNFFAVLGVQPMFGRAFTAEECQDRFSAAPAMLLSHGFWQRRFASDPAVIGKKLMLNNRPSTVVGILPESFDFASVFAPGTPVDVFIPWPLTPETNQRGNTTKVIGRLKPNATLGGAQAEFTLLAKQIESQHPERNGLAPKLTALDQYVSGRTTAALLVLACAIGVVMLVVCANLANLQLARMATRQKELALRAALGAGRLRMLRQMLTESLALAGCGAGLGLLLAVAGTRGVSHLSAFRLPLLASVRIDGTALAFTLLAAVLTGVLFGLLPALQANTFEPQGVLKETSRGLAGSKTQTWLRNGLVVFEIALACILLVGAGLLIRSFQRVLDVDLGFQPERAAALRVDPSFRLTTQAEQNSYIDDLLTRARSVPGIRAAGLTDVLPLGGDRSWGVSALGQTYARGQTPEAFIRVVSDGYFEAAGVRLLSGRLFNAQDRAGADRVVILNQTLARTLFPGQNPLGQMMTRNGRVVGVVADVRHAAVEKTGGGEMYIALRQTGDYSSMQLVVRTALPPETLAVAVRSALRPLDPNLPVSQFQTLQDLVDKAVSPRRLLVLLLAGFSAFALVLAALGIYAVVSYSVTQRAPEIGIRMALGASASDLQRGIVTRTLGLAAIGLILGMVGSRALSTTLDSMLFGITTGDPVTFVEVGALLLVMAAVAGYVPAFKASRIDPMVALRST